MLETICLSAIALAATTLTIIAARKWLAEGYLCQDCKFNQPELCHKQERPHALVCYSYRSSRSSASRGQI